MRDPFHQPWFAYENFFPFISFMLWQDVIYEGKSCIKYFLLDEEGVTLWGQVLEDSHFWTPELIHHSKNFFGEFLVSSNCAISKHQVKPIDIGFKSRAYYDNGNPWFLDGSDAYWFGSSIIKEKDPCINVAGQKANLLAKSTLQLLLVQRKSARRFNNQVDIMGSIREFEKSPGAQNTKFNVSMTQFDGLRLTKQVELMRSIDIIIAVHGAGLTNVAFMKPCSIVFEVFPFGLEKADHPWYFGLLARQTDLLHYSWIAEKGSSHLLPDANVAGGKDCKGYYDTLPVDPTNAWLLCYDDKYCRACAKLTTIDANIQTFQSLLPKALSDRQTCINNHPLYQ